MNTHRVEALNLPPGRYFPRIARPHHQQPEDRPRPFYGFDLYAHERASAFLQFQYLSRELQATFETVHPVQANATVYGSAFRNILLLAATEIETQFQGILRANNYKARGRLSTQDYFKIESAMRLADYSVSLIALPWLAHFSPFMGWTADTPTKSLAWYDAYNSVKHNRDEHFSSATMHSAMMAVCAVYIVLGAQFGFQDLSFSTEYRDVYRLVRMPAWSIGDTHGHDHWSGEGDRAVDFPFE